eukprot:CAMPEP_0179213278 /NCGR_PEP_ID=MMETSP0797-20121207/1598_1 /TAXON_ID=47934 /ORGANISM="Dinophysis acuminata, Strain DAEP01" /LENGTH=67 /DNA_ID=CAMNT_0020919035 /DNA_START=396 /DNA_END=596 /DNA_ORIENTATION=+
MNDPIQVGHVEQDVGVHSAHEGVEPVGDGRLLPVPLAEEARGDLEAGLPLVGVPLLRGQRDEVRELG